MIWDITAAYFDFIFSLAFAAFGIVVCGAIALFLAAIVCGGGK